MTAFNAKMLIVEDDYKITLTYSILNLTFVIKMLR